LEDGLQIEGRCVIVYFVGNKWLWDLDYMVYGVGFMDITPNLFKW